MLAGLVQAAAGPPGRGDGWRLGPARWTLAAPKAFGVGLTRSRPPGRVKGRTVSRGRGAITRATGESERRRGRWPGRARANTRAETRPRSVAKGPGALQKHNALHGGGPHARNFRLAPPPCQPVCTRRHEMLRQAISHSTDRAISDLRVTHTCSIPSTGQTADAEVQHCTQ